MDFTAGSLGQASRSSLRCWRGAVFGTARLRGLRAFPGPLKERAKIVELAGDFDDPLTVKVKANIAADVAFDEVTDAKSVRGIPVLQLFAAVREVIALRVLAELDEELARRFPGLPLSVGMEHAPPERPPPVYR